MGRTLVTQAKAPKAVSPKCESSGYIPALDGIRAIGIALVVICHLARPVWFGGSIGVDIFFVLSGYLITTILLREHDRTGSIKIGRFYLRRLIRLYPALIVAVAVLFVPGLVFAPDLVRYLWESLIALTYTAPILLELGVRIPQAWGHTWTLGLEELFYLAWPVVLIGILRAWRMSKSIPFVLAGIGFTLLAASIVLGVFFHRETWLLQSGGMLVGCALAFQLKERPPISVSPAVAWVGLSLIGGAVGLQTAAPWVAGVPVLLAWAGTVAIIAHLTTSDDSAVHRLLGAGPIVYLGKISYELYLWHYPLMLIIGWATGIYPILMSWLILPLALGLSAASHHLLQGRVQRWKLKAS